MHLSMGKIILLPVFSAMLLRHGTALSLQRRVDAVPESCEEAGASFWASDVGSTALMLAVEYIKCHSCEVPSPPPPDESSDDSSCDLWADPHVSGFDNKELQGPDYLYLMSHVDKSNSSDSEEPSHHLKHKIGHHGQHNITFTTSLRTFDKRPVDVNALDAGDFWLVKNPAVFIQGRFRLAQEFLPDNAAIGSIAVGGPFLEGDKIVVEPLDGQMLLNAFAIPSGNMSMKTTSGNISMLHYKPTKRHHAADGGQEEEHADVNLDLPKGVKMTIRRWKRHLDVKIRMPKLEGGVDGECGNMNGIPDDDTENLIQERMGSLKIQSRHKLFMKSFSVNVRLDEDGFNAVQKAEHPRAMSYFIHALLADNEAQVLSEADLQGLVSYYNGDLDKKSYRELLRELREAPWVQGFEPPTEKNIFRMAIDEVNNLFR